MGYACWQKALLGGFCVLVLSACGGGGGQMQLSVTPRSADTTTLPALNEALDRVVTTRLQASDASNVGLLLEIPSKHYRYLRTTGHLHSNTPLRVASIAKTFTATVVLQLVEEGYFTLDTPIAQLINPQHLPHGYTLADLQVTGGFKSGESVTVRHLLQHTAAMPDYMPSLFNAIINDILNNQGRGVASQQWQGTSLLAHYLQTGLARNGTALPGQRFQYSDTHYLLLGLVIEQVTGQSLTANYRARIFNRLGMANTWHEGFESPRGQVTAHYYHLAAQGINRNLDISATNLNTSAAWASGAIVSTLEDVALFQRSLSQGALFRLPSTLAQMRQVSAVSPNYALGVQRGSVSGLETWGHAGFWGVIMLHIPAKDAFLVLSVNQASRDMYQEAGKVLEAVRRAGF